MRAPERRAPATAAATALAAASGRQLCLGSIAAVRIVPQGFATPWPAMSGAEPRARTDPEADTDPLRFCRPPQFLGSSGDLPFNVEILFTPGRVTITNEGGLIRRIYTDGRALPHDVEPTRTGYSVGRWEGDTLVVETVDIDPDATFPARAPGGSRIGERVKITERIALEDEETLVFDVTTEAPELFTAPDRRRIPFARSAQAAAREIDFCVDFDRAVDPATGQERFDTTPPADLPPPARR